MSTPLPAPQLSKFVLALNAAIDTLIKGLGEPAAIIAATAELPLLAAPVVKQVFAWFVSQLAISLDITVVTSIDNLVILAKNKIDAAGYKSTVNDMKTVTTNPGATDADKAAAVARARAAVDALIQQGTIG